MLSFNLQGSLLSDLGFLISAHVGLTKLSHLFHPVWLIWKSGVDLISLSGIQAVQFVE